MLPQQASSGRAHPGPGSLQSLQRSRRSGLPASGVYDGRASARATGVCRSTSTATHQEARSGLCGVAAAAVIVGTRRRILKRHVRRASSEDAAVTGTNGVVEVPQDLYELLGVSADSDADQIKKGYYEKMKVCHPDIAGDDGAEACVLLNEAYDVLSNKEEKKAYDIELAQTNGSKQLVIYDEDVSPTWDWTSKTGNKKTKPVYNGRPLSRSLYHKVSEEGKGPKHDAEKFVFVDEWTCISCRACCEAAPSTFCIDADAGRARVFAQWGDGEDYLDEAVQSCPVDCIYWVSREELQVLEYVTRDRMFEIGNQPPCSMTARRTGGVTDNPFGMAEKFTAKQAEEKRRQEALAEGSVNVSAMQERIRELFGRINETLRRTAWG
ncbi:DJC76 [Symbiodinium natans]|uniref:DJC76 protein n=1 Tax=Symbiodinium natans TaxID=878477 RepID=A0A812I6S3_9DINO|nr:DJC76 [Symbiodinium natans]